MILPRFCSNSLWQIHFLDNKKYKETLKKLIDIDNIPTDLGGNLTLPAPQIEAWSKDEKKKLKEQAATEEIEAEKNAGNFSPEPNEWLGADDGEENEVKPAARQAKL